MVPVRLRRSEAFACLRVPFVRVTGGLQAQIAHLEGLGLSQHDGALDDAL